MHPSRTLSPSRSFRLEEYFAGEVDAWGIFQDRFGRVRRQFHVAIDGRWDGRTLTLTEDFAYDDGTTEQRIWTVRPHGRNRYVGRADGVLGEATGVAHGNAVNWKYRFALPIGGRSLTVRFDDWMYLQDDGVMINRASVTKLGIRLGEATIVFRRRADAVAAPQVMAAE